MQQTAIQKKYFNLLDMYLKSPNDEFRLRATDLGRELVNSDLPVEQIAEMHEVTLARIASENPETALLETSKLVSAPLMELLMAYRMAFSERLAEQMNAEEEQRRRNEELEVLSVIAKVLAGSKGFDYKRNRILKEIAQATGADFVGLRHVDESGSNLELIASICSPDFKYQPTDSISLTAGKGLFPKAYTKGEAFLINDYPANPSALSSVVEQGVRSAVLIPIMARDCLMGMLSVLSRDTGYFTPDRAQLLTGISDGLGIFLENAQLNDQVSAELELRRQSEEQLRQQTQDLQALLGFARVATGPGSLEDKLKGVLEALREISDSDAVALRIPDPRTGAMVLVAETGDGTINNRPRVITSGVTVESFKTGEPVIANDYGAFPTRVPSALALGIKSVMTLPVKTGRTILGTVILTSDRLDYFAPALASRITSLVEGVGVLLENARLNSEITFKEELHKRRDTFVSVASHKIRTPMAVIEGHSELLLNKDLPDPVKQESLERIHRNPRSLAAIVEDMLDVSRIHSGKLSLNPDFVSLDDLLSDVAASLHPIYPQHQLAIGLDEETPPVFADADKLDQVLTNVVDNAFKYSPDGGTVRISSTHNAEDSRVVVAIADEGVGIASENQEQLFDVFHRIRSPETANIKGSGLGLYIVKEILDLLNGEIWVESELGLGATFRISLPTE